MVDDWEEAPEELQDACNSAFIAGYERGQALCSEIHETSAVLKGALDGKDVSVWPFGIRGALSAILTEVFMSAPDKMAARSFIARAAVEAEFIGSDNPQDDEAVH